MSAVNETLIRDVVTEVMGRLNGNGAPVKSAPAPTPSAPNPQPATVAKPRDAKPTREERLAAVKLTGAVERLFNTRDLAGWYTTGFHRDRDVEKTSGEWNVLECLCAGEKISVFLNGTFVNEAVKVTPTRGRISFQSHGAEIFFRKVELQHVVKQ